MKLYYSPGACSLAVRIIIKELSLSCDFEAVNLKTKITENGTPFLTINPKGSVPVLILDDGKTITENAVIQQYLADTYKAYTLLPSIGMQERYTVLSWLNYVSTELHKNCGPLFNPNMPQSVKEEIVKPLLKSKLDFVNQHLQDHLFLAGEQFTLPDSYLFTVLRWIPSFSMDLQSWPQIYRYINTLKNRPSVQTALKEEGLHI